jgi:predicted RNase H-like HicB family nuclease
MRYALVIEKADGNYSAYVPDLPGCVATGDTVAAVENEIRDAIRFHIDGLRPMASRFRSRPASLNTSRRK